LFEVLQIDIVTSITYTARIGSYISRMATPSRHSNASNISSDSRTFFVTSSTHNKRSLLQSERSAGLFVEVLYHYRAQRKYRLHEWVVMPDHFHLLLTVGSDMSIERAVQFVKGGFAFRAGKELGARAPFWQKGFSEVRVFDGQQYAEIRDYIRNNPVKKHLVAQPEEYLYSSARPGFELDSPPQRLKPVEIVAFGDMAEAIS
jgi:REP-associated tyrosine transposase